MTREHKPFPGQVGRKADRKQRAREQRDSIWFGLGMFGLVGWSVAIPTLLGIAVGVWLDSRGEGQDISWTLTGLAVGIIVGCLIAWFWVQQESTRGMEDTQDTQSSGPGEER